MDEHEVSFDVEQEEFEVMVVVSCSCGSVLRLRARDLGSDTAVRLSCGATTVVDGANARAMQVQMDEVESAWRKLGDDFAKLSKRHN